VGVCRTSPTARRFGVSERSSSSRHLSSASRRFFQAHKLSHARCPGLRLREQLLSPALLHAWYELPVEDLRGRCPHRLWEPVPSPFRDRVADRRLSVGTFLTTFCVMVDDFCPSRHQPKRRPGPEASLSDSEVIILAVFPGGTASLANETSTATPKIACARPSPPCPIARSSIGWGAPAWVSPRRWPCTWRSRWVRELAALSTRPWTPRPCPFGTRSAGARDGWPALRRHRLV
jgi:hypothetical protein